MARSALGFWTLWLFTIPSLRAVPPPPHPTPAPLSILSLRAATPSVSSLRAVCAQYAGAVAVTGR